MLRESYDSAYTLLFSGLAVVTLLCALMIWLTLCRKGALSKPATVDPEPLDSAVASRSRQPPFRSAQRTGIVIVSLTEQGGHMRRPAAETVSQAAVWRVIRTGLYRDPETVLMATPDPDLWKSALQKLAFLTGSALMELFNVKPAENAVAELLVRGMTPTSGRIYRHDRNPP